MLPAIRLLATSDEAIPEQQLHQALHEPFDLENELSVRWYVVEQLSGKLVYLVSHHIALDGCGLTVLASELFDILDGKAHSPSQLYEKFGQAHLVEVSSVEHSYDVGKSSPKSSSEHGQATEGYKNAEATCLNQLMDTFPLQWEKAPQQGSRDFRRLQSWVTLSKNAGSYPRRMLFHP